MIFFAISINYSLSFGNTFLYLTFLHKNLEMSPSSIFFKRGHFFFQHYYFEIQFQFNSIKYFYIKQYSLFTFIPIFSFRYFYNQRYSKLSCFFHIFFNNLFNFFFFINWSFNHHLIVNLKYYFSF